MSDKPILNILITSTRPTRKGPSVAKWAHQVALTHGKFDARLVDLASFELPVFDEPDHPSMQKYVHEYTKSWSRSVNEADAFVFVQPEYNHFPPSSLINAMEYLYREWSYKPVAFVSYAAGPSGGMRSVEATKVFCTTFKMMPMVEGVAIPGFEKHLDKDGVFIADETLDGAAVKMLDETLRWADALKVLR
jgi:NAD(P)H-dependent FMN reductase